jgi:hypothetical protein
MIAVWKRLLQIIFIVVGDLPDVILLWKDGGEGEEILHGQP